MRIEMKTLYAGPDRTISPGQVVDLPDDEARELIDGGYAVQVGDDQGDDEAVDTGEPVEPRKVAKKAAAPKRSGE